jgi:hypothetical protein
MQQWVIQIGRSGEEPALVLADIQVMGTTKYSGYHISRLVEYLI